MQFITMIDDIINVSMKEAFFTKLNFIFLFSFLNKINSIITTSKIPKYANNLVSKNKYIEEKKTLKISSSLVDFFFIKVLLIRR